MALITYFYEGKEFNDLSKKEVHLASQYKHYKLLNTFLIEETWDSNLAREIFKNSLNEDVSVNNPSEFKMLVRKEIISKYRGEYKYLIEYLNVFGTHKLEVILYILENSIPIYSSFSFTHLRKFIVLKMRDDYNMDEVNNHFIKFEKQDLLDVISYLKGKESKELWCIDLCENLILQDDCLIIYTKWD